MLAPSQTYEQFLARKSVSARPAGFDPGIASPAAMKPFQRDITTWACRRGRAAVFAGTGLGKTLMELSWAENVVDQTQGQVLLFTPLAVAEQTVLEARKFGVAGVAYAPDQSAAKTPIVVTNYDRRDKFDVSKFAGIVLDESGIIKDHASKTRVELTEACRDIPYLLCGSATPAPNDWTELGQHAEFLGVMSAKEMLAMFFVHDGAVRADANGEEWRLKGHAKDDFWRWVASWSVMIRHPRDLGYEDAGYDLPPLTMHQLTVKLDNDFSSGMLFPKEATTLQERLRARKDSISERVAAAHKLVMDDWACGNRNTKSDGAQSAWLNQSKSAGNRTPEPLKRIASTCEPTIKLTKTDGTNERQSSEQSITRPGVSGTLLTQSCDGSLGSGIGSTPRAEESGTLASNESSGSLRKSMPPNLKSRAAGAPSAIGGALTADCTDSTSITAIKPEQSEGCCAAVATSALENSGTIPTFSRGQLSTSPARERWLIWCNLNSEQDALEKAFGSDLCLSVYGSLDRSEKVSRIRQWLAGERPILLSKPSIIGRGLNLQCCNRMVFVGLNDSFEQLFQAVRRCWRFGQEREVNTYLIASELEGAVVKNLQNKERKYEAMADAMAAHMIDLCRAQVRGGRISASTYEPKSSMELPAWLQ